ncbi:hypothetical protein IMZ68_03295, partial [Candidatus Bathyarchaeota archaeon]|nr:hypothetical protein [Candidatus Bathyarchaeota archaeon]
MITSKGKDSYSHRYDYGKKKILFISCDVAGYGKQHRAEETADGGNDNE